MIFPESQMVDCVCYECGGKGKVYEQGFFSGTVTNKLIDCRLCEGRKIVKRIPDCHNRIHYECRGDKCNLWDRDNGGGCLERKALLKQLGND